MIGLKGQYPGLLDDGGTFVFKEPTKNPRFLTQGLSGDFVARQALRPPNGSGHSGVWGWQAKMSVTESRIPKSLIRSSGAAAPAACLNDLFYRRFPCPCKNSAKIFLSPSPGA